MTKYYNIRKPTIISEHLYGQKTIAIELRYKDKEYPANIFATDNKDLRNKLAGISQFERYNTRKQNKTLKELRLLHSQPVTTFTKVPFWLRKFLKMNEKAEIAYGMIVDGPTVDIGEGWIDLTDEEHPLIKKIKNYKKPKEGVTIHEGDIFSLKLDKLDERYDEGTWLYKNQLNRGYKINDYIYDDLVIMNLEDYLADPDITLYRLCNCCWSVDMRVRYNEKLDLYLLHIENRDDQYARDEIIILKGSRYKELEL